MSELGIAAALVAGGIAAMRWLRVAQREHYLAGRVTRFAKRWWLGFGFNRILAAVVVVDVALAFVHPFFAVVAAAPIAAGPFGLRLRGVAPGPVVWTRRLRTLAAAAFVIAALVVVVGAIAGFGAGAAALTAALAPLVIDGACLVTGPLERALGRPHVDRAAARLREIAPLVVGITGSYGKTTTKGYVAHLVGGAKAVVATPGSFNNSAGLARAVNEHLGSGTEVFVAEMGTYGPGEIADLCAWVRPAIAAITAIGPVHLERMRSEGVIASAKEEIFSTANVAVLNVDSPRLAEMAGRLAGDGKHVVRCSGVDRSADVSAIVEGGATVVRDASGDIGRVDTSTSPTNVAVAVALALEAGASRDVVGKLLPTLPTAANRLAVTSAASGASILDDTYNANPAGAAAALDALARHARPGGRRVVVTPGMVELGDRQWDENVAFAAAAAAAATHLIIVGHTNRAALLEGARGGTAAVIVVDDHRQAVEWVRHGLGRDDVVLYENQLPDHFP